MAISILIPIERFSFFVPACVDNIIKTAGVPKDQIDIVFIVSKQATSWVLDAINESNCRKLFVDVPTDLDKGLGLEHQIMLDVAMKDKSLEEWVVIQHCDLIWRKEGWLKELEHLAKTSKKTTIPHCQLTKHFVRGKPVPLVGDFFGFFNRTKFKKEMSFRCGYFKNEWVDGSVLLSIKLAELNEIDSPVNFSGYFYHLMAFFRIWESFVFEDGLLKTNLVLGDAFGLPKDLWVKSFAAYSYLTSFAIQKEEIGDKILPWNFFSKVVDVNLQEVVSICDFFIKDKLPLNRNKVDEIIFSNQKFFKEVKLL